MNFKRLFGRGKQAIEDRGGVESLKTDAKELRDIAKGEGSLSDKAKAAAAAVKDEGARGDTPAEAPVGQAEPSSAPGGGDKPDEPATQSSAPPAAS
jgi:hypothetical protein